MIIQKKQGSLNVFKGLEKEINSLRSDKVYVIESYIEYLAIQGRMKRSLIPIVGKALGYLFGTAIEGDIKAIQRNIKRLAQNQKEIADVVDESILVTNITRIELAENRYNLGQITASLVQLDSKLEDVTQLLEKQIIEVEYIVQMYLQLESIIEEIRRTIRQASFDMEHLQLQLNMLSLGHLSPCHITKRLEKDADRNKGTFAPFS